MGVFGMDENIFYEKLFSKIKKRFITFIFVFGTQVKNVFLKSFVYLT